MILVSILSALMVLAGVVILAIGRKQPDGTGLDIEDRAHHGRPLCWVDDPLYDSLGYVSDEWVKSARKS